MEGENAELVYSVTWRAKSNSNEKSRQREINTTNLTLLIDELQPETAYLIQVCAVFGHTKSPYASLDVRTLSERPIPGRPVDFRAEFVDLALPADDSAAAATSLTDSNRVLRV